MSSRAERAARRATEWTAEIVDCTAEANQKRLCKELSATERLALLVDLNARAWHAAHGKPPARLPRSEWHGEIFEAYGYKP